MSKKWKLADSIPDNFIKEFPDLSPVVLQLLHNRGIKTQEQIDEFFNADFISDICDPYVLIDMERAVKRIFEAVEKNEEVLIYGDYDADGVTSSALLYDIFTQIGLHPEVYIPQRETEGYGLNEGAVKEIISRKFNLVVTCDCGISNFDEVEIFNKSGVDVIITDHHKEPEKLPNAFAIIHPGLKRENYKTKNLAGVGVTYKLASGIIKSDLFAKDKQEKEKSLKWLLDLVAIGSVTDMVPLIGENRTLVKYGLIVLRKTQRLGLQQLYEIAGTNVEKINSMTIGFQIGPRLNSAGRMDHANNAFELLKTNNLETAIKIARELNISNSKRQDLTNKIVLEAKSQIDCVDENTKFIFVKNERWNLGIIGLVAGKLSQEYYRPSFVLGHDNKHWVCSCRSIDEIDIMEVILKFSDKLIRFGGHKSAAGFSLPDENLEYVQNVIKDELEKKLLGLELSSSLKIEAEINLANIDWNLCDYLEKFEPFGMENPEPKFLLKNCIVKEISTMGSDKSHLRITLEQDGIIKRAVGFGFANKFSNLKIGDKIDLVVNIGINEWNGNRNIEIYISDINLKENV
ncbi:MAG: single-stranded-DNA-specific exonuclease RecJ [Patescibacteria group bacterium]|nr:single-stranded-DNA-specific exonuclease RecJ [Patescibacteria group bacterium]